MLIIKFRKEVHIMMIAKIIAIVIFVLMFALIIMDKIPRHWVTLGCGLATIVIVFGICMKLWRH